MSKGVNSWMKRNTYPEVESLNLRVAILGQIILCCRRCPKHGRTFRNIPDPYPLDASNPSSCCESPKCHQTLSHGGQTMPSLKLLSQTKATVEALNTISIEQTLMLLLKTIWDVESLQMNWRKRQMKGL